MGEHDERGGATDDATPDLAALAQPARTTGWRSTGDVVRVVRTRRRRRTGLAAGGTVVVAAALVAAVTLSGSGSDTPPAPIAGARVADRLDGALQLVATSAPLADADASSASRVTRTEQALTLRMLHALSVPRTNTSVSALSLYSALGMLQNGARGTTESQLASVLSGLDTGEQNAGIATVLADLARAAASDEITVQNANSVWQQQGFAVEPAFLQSLATYFHNGVWQTDFAHAPQRAADAINAWVSQQTHGLITKLLDSLDPSTVLVLANALYFHAAWQTPFDPHNTDEGSFTTGTGKQVQVKYISGVDLRSVDTGAYMAASLPYTGNRFAALAIMPKSGTLAQFVAGLSATGLTGIASAVSSAHVTQVGLPRFTTSSSLDLEPMLQSFGATDMFTDHADLTGINAQQPLTVDHVVQRVYVSVGEKGTTAAAATGVVARATAAIAAPPRFDHPFLFLVRDTKTGAILFATAVNDPTAG